MTVSRRPGVCGLCTGDRERRLAVDRSLAMGKGPKRIEHELRGGGLWPISIPLIAKHREHYMGAVTDKGQREVLRRLAGSYTPVTDLALLVRDEARARIEDGELEVTVSHGLAAQAMLDRREEKQQERELALGLARLLSGSGASAPARVIDGSSERLGSGDLTDAGLYGGLGAAHRVATPKLPSAYRTRDTDDGGAG